MSKNDDPVQEDGSSSGFIKKLVEDVYNEIPIGELDGVNCTFRLASMPLIGSEKIYVNGVVQRRGIDYTIVNDYFVLNDAPTSSESLICSYGKTSLREILNEIPSGEINGMNNVFVLNNIPILGSENIYLNGILLINGENDDYVIKDNIVTLVEYPGPGELITCTYRTNL
jgi:hypothetical protein